MLDRLISVIRDYKESIREFENQKGVIILDKSSKKSARLVDRIYQDATFIIKDEKSSDRGAADLNQLIKDALKKIFFNSHNIGIVLLQESKIVIRGEIDKHNVLDFIDFIFEDRDNLNEFVLESLLSHLSKNINLSSISLENIFNIPNIYERILKDLIEYIDSDIYVQQRLNESDIDLEELKEERGKSFLYMNLVAEEILKDTLERNRASLLGYISDYLLRNTATLNTNDLKYIKNFFETKLIENSSSRVNFTQIRKNSSEREKYLKLIDKAQERMKKAKSRESQFIKKRTQEEQNLSSLEQNFKEVKEKLELTQDRYSKVFQEREKLRKSKKAQKEQIDSLSERVKELNRERTNLDIEYKNLTKAVSESKQKIENLEQDRVDHIKLLPEILKTEESKIEECKLSIKSSYEDYIKIKRTLIKELHIKKPEFNIEKFMASTRKVILRDESSKRLNVERNPNEKRFKGFPPDELEKIKCEVFQSEEELNAIFAKIVNRLNSSELDFRKINNIYFLNNNIKFVQKYLFTFLKNTVSEANDDLIEGLGNYILRLNFQKILQFQAKKLLKYLMDENVNVQNFISYYDGKIERDKNGNYKKPALVDSNSEPISPNRLFSIVTKYRDYKNTISKIDLNLKSLNLKLKKLKTLEERVGSDKVKLDNILENIDKVLREISKLKEKREEIIERNQHILETFQDISNSIAKVLSQKRERVN